LTLIYKTTPCLTTDLNRNNFKMGISKISKSKARKNNRFIRVEL